MIEDYWDAMETTIEEVIIDFPKRTVTILNSEGDQTIVPCLLYTSPSPRDKRQSRMPSSA